MIQDTQELFSGTIAADGTRAGQAITASGLSTNVLDLRNSGSPALVDEGINGTPGFWFTMAVTAAFNNLTSLQVELISDSASNLTTAPVSHYSITIPLASLTAGSTPVRVMLPSADYKRYVGVRYTVTGTAPTTGQVMTFFALDIQRNVIYPSGFTVDA